jgi:hypothetical protein
MHFTNAIRYSLVIGAMLAHTAGATTIIQSAGNSEASVPLGYYAPYAPYNATPTVYTVGWTQTSDYTDVDVFANLFTPGSPGTVNYALVDAIGPGTSFAANGIVEGTATTPANPTEVDLFHLTSLAAGTYYLVLDSSVPNTSWQYNFPFQSNFTMDTGVSYLGAASSSGSPSINTGYTPGSTFSGAFYPVEFQVTGNVAAPEPATLAGTGLALIGLSIVLRRTRGSRAQKKPGISAGPGSETNALSSPRTFQSLRVSQPPSSPAPA